MSGKQRLRRRRSKSRGGGDGEGVAGYRRRRDVGRVVARWDDGKGRRDGVSSRKGRSGNGRHCGRLFIVWDDDGGSFALALLSN
ncbi:hypothetical protein NL676_005207 [Syzygium grande]|nr:hypothetical protein NL676_005207 [Syzygium grande]